MVGAACVIGAFGLTVAAPAAAQFRQPIRNDMNQCQSDSGTAVLVTVEGIKSSS